jgi:hypothetical protein
LVSEKIKMILKSSKNNKKERKGKNDTSQRAKSFEKPTKGKKEKTES